MVKLTVYQLSELTKEQQNLLIAQLDACFTPDYATANLKSEHNVEAAVDEDGKLYDIRVFDPFHFIKTGGNTPLYIGPDGWSNWLLDYRDPAGNDIDTILQD